MYLCMYVLVCTYTSFLDTSDTALLLHREEAIDTQNPLLVGMFTFQQMLGAYSEKKAG